MPPKAKKLKLDDDTCKGEVFMAELSDILQKDGFNLDYKALANKFKNSPQSEYSLRYFFNTKLIPASRQDDRMMDIHESYSKYLDILRDRLETIGPTANLPKMCDVYGALGPHPPSESCDGVDYPAIYRTLAAFMRGHIPPELNVPTSAKLLSAIKEVKGRVHRMMSSPTWKPQRTVRRPNWRGDVPQIPERQAELKDRRKKEWSEEEKDARLNALSNDMARVRLTLVPEIAFNPFGYVFPPR